MFQEGRLQPKSSTITEKKKMLPSTSSTLQKYSTTLPYHVMKPTVAQLIVFKLLSGHERKMESLFTLFYAAAWLVPGHVLITSSVGFLRVKVSHDSSC